MIKVHLEKSLRYKNSPTLKRKKTIGSQCQKCIGHHPTHLLDTRSGNEAKNVYPLSDNKQTRAHMRPHAHARIHISENTSSADARAYIYTRT